MKRGGRRLQLPWPRRVDMALLCFAANVIAHCDRVSLGAAAPLMMQEYGWTTAQMGWVLSAFFAGYAGAMIPAGMLAQRYGPRRVFAVSMGAWSLFTLLTPFSRGTTSLAALRLLLGVGESGTSACINGTLARWFPPGEFARAAGLCWSGGYAGPVLAFPVAAFLAAQFGWRSIFVVFGLLGFLWLPLWLRVREPGAPMPSATGEGRPAMDWRVLRLPAIWAVFLLHFSSNWFLYVMISWLPTYLTVERKLPVAAITAGSALPFVFAWAGTNFFAWVIDRWGGGGGGQRDRTRVRKLAMLPYALAALSIFLMPRVSSPEAAVGLLCAAMGLLAAATPVFSSASLDLAPSMAAALAALQNAFANVAGIIAPAAIGYLVGQPGGWNVAFALTAAICLTGAAAYLSMGDAR